MRADTVPMSAALGVNLLDDPAAIKDNEFAWAKNLWHPKRGVLALRPSMQFFEDVYQKVYSDSTPLEDIGVPLDFAFVESGSYTELLYIERRGGTDYLNLHPPYLSSFVSQNIGPSKYVPQILRYGKRTYVFNGEASGWYVDPTVLGGDGQMAITQVDWGDAAHLSVKPKFAAVVRERFWYANLGNGAEDYVVVSDRFEPSVIGTVGADPLLAGGRAFRVGSPGEGPITAIAELSATKAGSEASTMVAVWKRDRLYLITGEPLETNDVGDVLGDMDIIRVNVAAGCAGHRTVVTTPYGTFWAGVDDVWCMPHGGQPMRVGTKIRPALAATPTTLTHLWHAVYDANHYKLAVFSDGQGPSDESACGEQWWLDLRSWEANPSGADECVWMGPQRYVPSWSVSPGTWNMHLDERPGAERRAISMQRYYFEVYDDGLGDFDVLYGLSLVSLDGRSPRDTCVPFEAHVPWLAAETYEQYDRIVEGTDESAFKREMQEYIHAVPSSDGPTGNLSPTFEWGNDAAGSTPGDVWYGIHGGTDSGRRLLAFEPPLAQRDNSVLFEIRTKEYLFGDGVTDKLWDGVELSYSATQDMSLSYTAIIDYETSSRVALLEATNRLDKLTLPTTLGMDRRWVAEHLEPDASKRSVGKSVQMRIWNTDKYVIPEGHGTIVLSAATTRLELTPWTEGQTFDSLNDLVLALCSAVTDAYPAGVYAKNDLAYAGVVSLTKSGLGAPDVALPLSESFGDFAVTAEEAAVNRWLAALLGLYQDATSVLLWTSATVVGKPTSYMYNPANVEFAAINLKVRKFNRRSR